MKYYIGVDCSKYKIHISVLNANSDVHKLDVLVFSEKKDIERMREIHDKFEDWLIDFVNGEDIVVEDIVVTVEGPIFINNPKTSADLSKTIYMAEFSCANIGAKCFEIQPTSWKKDVLGNGAAKKEDVMKFAETKWPNQSFDTQDWADASCISFYNYMRFNNNNGSSKRKSK